MVARVTGTGPGPTGRLTSPRLRPVGGARDRRARGPSGTRRAILERRPVGVRGPRLRADDDPRGRRPGRASTPLWSCGTSGPRPGCSPRPPPWTSRPPTCAPSRPPGRGEVLVRDAVARWEDTGREDDLIFLLRTAVTSEAVAAQVQAAVGQLITGPVAALGGDRVRRARRFIAAQLLGLALCRYILRLEPLASLPRRRGRRRPSPRPSSGTSPRPSRPRFPSAKASGPEHANRPRYKEQTFVLTGACTGRRLKNKRTVILYSEGGHVMSLSEHDLQTLAELEHDLGARPPRCGCTC